MNFIEDFKKHLESDNLSGEYQNFTQDKSTISLKLPLGGKKKEVVINPTHIEITDTDFKSSGTSLWDDFEEVKSYLKN